MNIADIDFKLDEYLRVKAQGEDGGSISSQSTDTLLLLAILEKLEKINQSIKNIGTFPP